MNHALIIQEQESLVGQIPLCLSSVKCLTDILRRHGKIQTASYIFISI